MKYGIWNVSKPTPQGVNSLCAAGYPELAARILSARGIETAAAAHECLDCNCELPSPYLLTEMDVAAGRVGMAMSAHEKIAVFGDYDVDGITSTCVLTDYLPPAAGNSPRAATPPAAAARYMEFSSCGISYALCASNPKRSIIIIQ